jgi:hypothetical protein
MKRRVFLAVLVAVIAILTLAIPVMAASSSSSTPSDLATKFTDIADGWKLVTLSVLVFSVLGLGVLNAALNKQLLLRRLWDIARKRIIPGVVGYYVLCFTGAVNDDLKGLATGAFAVFTAVLVGDVLANLKELGVPFPLPDSVTKFLTAESEEPKT